MAFTRRLSVFASASLAALTLSALLPSAAFAAGPMSSGSVGSDISWPQCGSAAPAGYSFGIIGITGGKPFTNNDCFANEFAWSQSVGTPQLYLNLDYGLRRDGPLWCSEGETGCEAYNYGYEAAAYAYRYAAEQTGGQSRGTATWWLDVETENYWLDDTAQNSYVIQGALDYLQRSLGRTVGVYSTHWQWGQIAGNFAPQATPNWIAGANDLQDYGKCSASLWPGAQVWAIQYLNLEIDLDENRAC